MAEAGWGVAEDSWASAAGGRWPADALGGSMTGKLAKTTSQQRGIDFKAALLRIRGLTCIAESDGAGNQHQLPRPCK
jgi:hypothetical protein